MLQKNLAIATQLFLIPHTSLYISLPKKEAKDASAQIDAIQFGYPNVNRGRCDHNAKQNTRQQTRFEARMIIEV